MKTYRIRVTETIDIKAASEEKALQIFHDGLTKRLNDGNDLGTDVCIATKEESTFAQVSWAASDVRTLRPKWTRKDAEEFLRSNEKRITEAMIGRGWDVIEDLL